MAIERVPASGDPEEALERVLDKGIVVDAHIRISVIGIDLVGADALVLADLVQKYTQNDERADEEHMERVRRENAELRRRLRAEADEPGDGA